MSLYSPKPSASSQAATSSEPHLSASREENQSGGLGSRAGSWARRQAQADRGSGGSRLRTAPHTPSSGRARGLSRLSLEQFLLSLAYGASKLLPLNKTPQPWGRDLPKGLSGTRAPFSHLQW